MERLIKLAAYDFLLIFRDNSLKFFLVLPFLNALVLRYGIPYVVDRFPAVGDYTILIVMMITIQGSLAFGFIYSMVLVDEKDTRVAKVYGVLPVSQIWFVLFRLIAPFVLSSSASALILFVQTVYDIPFLSIIGYSVLVGLVAPSMVLFVAILSKNKIEAMTWQKIYNLPATLPILAFLLPASFTWLFAILPTHWAFQGFNNIVEGKSLSVYVLAGVVHSVAFICLLARRFSKTHFR